MWHELAIPACPANIRGYTHADLGVIFVATTGGFFALEIVPDPKWQRISDRIEEYQLFNDDLITFADDALLYRDKRFALFGYPLLDGVDFSDIPLDTHPNGQELRYDPETDAALILEHDVIVQRIPIGISEEWSTAGYSSDGRHLTFASLKRIRIFEYVVE